MRRVAQRPLLLVAFGVAALAGWLGLPPFLAGPGPAAVGVAPGRSAVISTAHNPSPTPITSAGPGTTGPTDTTGSPGRPPPLASRSPRLGNPSATPSMRRMLDTGLPRLRAQAGIPGVSAAIIFPDGSMWVGASGLADVATARPVSPDTAFAVASVSKTFTAALILTLVEDKRIALDVPVVTYLPELAIDRRITVRQLLDHSSGLRDFFFHKEIDAALQKSPGRRWDAADALRYVGKPYFKPGAGWHYSNTNYLVLGLLAERVGGASVAAQLRQRFIDPLGLADTYYQALEQPRGPTAHGYRFSGPGRTSPPIDLSDGTTVVPFTSVVTAAGAAGSIATSAGDLARWARALYGGSVLGPQMRKAMLGHVRRTIAYEPSTGYGLGVQVVTIDGHATLGHSGRLLGFSAVMRWLPDEGIAIVVLTDQSRTDPDIVLDGLLRIGLQHPSDCVTCPVQR